MQARTQIDKQGKLHIPLAVRKQLGYKSGDVFMIRIINDELNIVSLDKIVKEAQMLIRQYVPAGHSMVDELLELRKKDREVEEQRHHKLAEKK